MANNPQDLRDYYYTSKSVQISMSNKYSGLFTYSSALALGIASIIIALQNPHSSTSCMGADDSGIYLDDWLFYKGLSQLIFICVSLIIFGLVFLSAFKTGGVPQWLGYSLIFFWIGYKLFTLAWWILGLVILIRSNNDCVNAGQITGILTIIQLVLG